MCALAHFVYKNSTISTVLKTVQKVKSRDRFIMLKKLALAVSLAASFQVAQATTNIYPLNGHQVLGEEQVYSINDTGTTTLEYVAAEYHLGLSNMIEANPGVDPIVPARGSKLIVPTKLILPPTVHEGIIVNSAEMRLYFFNGGNEVPFEGEDRILVPSPAVATYDLQPEMSAPEVTDKVVDAIHSGQYDMIILNYANPDMVGHTGDFKAAVKAIQTVDAGLERIAKAILEVGGQLLVTADHGNAEQMVNHETGKPHTAHTTNVVPLILVGAQDIHKQLKSGKLCDIAPTMLALAHIDKPSDMTGESLLID